MSQDPGYDIGDILRGTLGNPLDAVAKADTKPTEPEQIEEQVRPPTDAELAEIEALAEKAANLQDKLKAVTGDMGGELRGLKAQLRDRLIKHGMDELKIAGRPPIELSSSNSTKPNRKKIIAACIELKDGDEKEGKKLGAAIWKKIGTTTSYSLSIPEVSPPDA